MAGDAMSVTLSRPARAARPRASPRRAPGLSATGRPAAHARAMAAARAASPATSRPITAAGTMPKFDSAENRPPIDGTPANVRRKPSEAARRSRLEPGSVIATKRAAARARPSREASRSKK